MEIKAYLVAIGVMCCAVNAIVVVRRHTFSGKYYWELYFDIDNSQNNEVQSRETAVIESRFYSFKATQKNAFALQLGLAVGAKAGGIYKMLSAQVEGQISLEVQATFDSMIQSEGYDFKEFTHNRSWTVGKHSKLKVYNLAFSGLGVHYKTGIYQTHPEDPRNVRISADVEETLVLTGFRVVYTTDYASRPDDSIEMSHGSNPNLSGNINCIYYNWLVPIWGTDFSQGATDLVIVWNDEKRNGYYDLTKGCGPVGFYIYVKIIRRENEQHRITKVGLFRGVSEDDHPIARGFQHFTEDINMEDYRYHANYLGITWETQNLL